MVSVRAAFVRSLIDLFSLFAFVLNAYLRGDTLEINSLSSGFLTYKRPLPFCLRPAKTHVPWHVSVSCLQPKIYLFLVVPRAVNFILRFILLPWYHRLSFNSPQQPSGCFNIISIPPRQTWACKTLTSDFGNPNMTNQQTSTGAVKLYSFTRVFIMRRKSISISEAEATLWLISEERCNVTRAWSASSFSQVGKEAPLWSCCIAFLLFF